MKRRLAMAMCGVVALAGASFAADAQELKTDKEKISYSIGMDIGGNLKRDPSMWTRTCWRKG